MVLIELILKIIVGIVLGIAGEIPDALLNIFDPTMSRTPRKSDENKKNMPIWLTIIIMIGTVAGTLSLAALLFRWLNHS